MLYRPRVLSSGALFAADISQQYLSCALASAGAPCEPALASRGKNNGNPLVPQQLDYPFRCRWLTRLNVALHLPLVAGVVVATQQRTTGALLAEELYDIC